MLKNDRGYDCIHLHMQICLIIQFTIKGFCVSK